MTTKDTEIVSRPAFHQQIAITQDARMRQAQAEILSRYQLAIMIPRDWIGVGRQLVKECEVSEFAKAAFYKKPTGSGAVEGLSIRFAERALQLMRNVAIETTPDMEDDHAVHFRITVTDLESNIPQSETVKVERTVERSSVPEGDTVLSVRTNSRGAKTYLIPATEDQMQVKVRAQKAIARRNLILSLIPVDLRRECLQKIKELIASGAATDPQGTIKEILASFLALGIDANDLKAYLGKSLQSMVPKDIEDLRGIYPLIRDGELTWNDVLEAKREQQQAAASTTKAEFVAQKQQQRASRKQKNNAAPKQPSEPETKPPGPGRGRRAASAQPETNTNTTTNAAAEKPPSAPAQRSSASRRGGDDDGSPDEQSPTSSSNSDATT